MWGVRQGLGSFSSCPTSCVAKSGPPTERWKPAQGRLWTWNRHRNQKAATRGTRVGLLKAVWPFVSDQAALVLMIARTRVRASYLRKGDQKSAGLVSGSVRGRARGSTTLVVQHR